MKTIGRFVKWFFICIGLIDAFLGFKELVLAMRDICQSYKDRELDD